MIRGALLHDFFLYDWHEKNQNHRLHGFTHPKRALCNAQHYFRLNDIERDVIEKHMWPMTLKPPRFKESLVVCLVDKCCTLSETLRLKWGQIYTEKTDAGGVN
ncbi:hypothetical protein SDC9_155059 [bioreactor metagenome]|uniref:Phosphohydrolase n=1 Tax=bioreactor metagenome TaxID=1076179 RepID=A0A645F0R6_9ZZZZ